MLPLRSLRIVAARRHGGDNLQPKVCFRQCPLPVIGEPAGFPATPSRLLLREYGFWMPCRSLGGAMKLTPTREAMPLTVWITLALMAIGAVVYLTGVVVVDDIMALLFDKK